MLRNIRMNRGYYRYSTLQFSMKDGTYLEVDLPRVYRSYPEDYPCKLPSRTDEVVYEYGAWTDSSYESKYSDYISDLDINEINSITDKRRYDYQDD